MHAISRTDDKCCVPCVRPHAHWKTLRWAKLIHSPTTLVSLMLIVVSWCQSPNYKTLCLCKAYRKASRASSMPGAPHVVCQPQQYCNHCHVVSVFWSARGPLLNIRKSNDPWAVPWGMLLETGHTVLIVCAGHASSWSLNRLCLVIPRILSWNRCFVSLDSLSITFSMYAHVTLLCCRMKDWKALLMAC